MNGKDIIDIVAHHRGIPQSAITGYSRAPVYAKPRQEVMFLTRYILEWSYPKVGELVHRHYTTAMHGEARVQERMAADTKYNNEIVELAQIIEDATRPVFRSIRGNSNRAGAFVHREATL